MPTTFIRTQTRATAELRDSDALVVTEAGAIAADRSVAMTGEGQSILNNGDITAESFGIIGFRDATATTPTVIANSGTISGGLDGIRLSAGDDIAGGVAEQLLSLRNDGLILGQGRGLDVQGDANLVINAGVIAGTTAHGIRIVSGNGEAAGNLIQNSGRIEGGAFFAPPRRGDGPAVPSPQVAIALDLRNDRVENAGRILGDVILGAGNDTFDGRGGTVRGAVQGGQGNDLFIVDDPGAVIVEANRQGNDTVQAWVDFIAPRHVEVLELQGPALRGTGNGQANRIVGNAQDNGLSGLGGNDQLFGDIGDDVLTGGAGNDRLFAGEGNDSGYGGAGNDTLTGQDGDDALRGDAGNDTLSGEAGNDSLDGGAGNDRLFGGAGDDILSGRAGNDRIDAGEGDDRAAGGTGNDAIFGLEGADTLTGDAGDDSLDGGADDDAVDGGNGRDSLTGGAGDDTLTGGRGNDILEGGIGADLLDAGPGFDSFVFRDAADSGALGIDTIVGFQPGEDVIDLSAIDANSNAGGNQAFTLIFSAPFSGAAGELRVEIVPGQRIVQADTDGDRLPDFALILDGQPILTGSAFLL